MKVFKFGGSSVAGADEIERVMAWISRAYTADREIAVVLSAMGGVTDTLIETARKAACGDSGYVTPMREIESRHIRVVEALFPLEAKGSVVSPLRRLFHELESVLHGVFLLRELSPRTLDLVMSFGERCSCRIVASALEGRGIGADFVDARRLIRTDDHFGAARVDFSVTNERIASFWKRREKLPVVTGFLGATERGETTTLGRGGSDYTAAILGAALDAEEVVIATDVDGVLTADPRMVSQAFPLRALSYEEAMEMSHFGARVIHPPTMQPLEDQGIPIRICNTFHPAFEGTVISSDPGEGDFLVKGISSIDRVALLLVQGSGMVGVPGVSMRLFGALARGGINVVLITQASSEHTICLAVDSEAAQRAREAIEAEFALEIGAHLIDPVVVEGERAIVAAVGEGMRRKPGIAGRLFQALGRNGINVVAIAQGSSERNISIVVSRAEEGKAVRVIHDAFFRTGLRTCHLFLVGPGRVGAALLAQIAAHQATLREKERLDLRLVGVANSRRGCFDQSGCGIDPSAWQGALAQGVPMTIDAFVEGMAALAFPGSIFLDCTASDEVADRYPTLLEGGISVITPNKRAASGPYPRWRACRETAERQGVAFRYETNVGAGLPILETLRDLLASGDEILRIEGVLSGTLSYLFNTFSAGGRFHEVLRRAQALGFTEPDPREDLSGLDVARKLLILARETGLQLEGDAVSVENLVPETCRGLPSVEVFFERLRACDDAFAARREAAAARGEVLRHLAVLEGGRLRVALESVGRESPFHRLAGSDNMVAFTTRRYADTPLVIQGPGAGPEVTAAGILAGIVSMAKHL